MGMSGRNPYEPPKTDVSLDPGERRAEELPTAGLGARFLNFLIDGIIARFVLVAILGAALQSVGPGERAGLLTLPVLLAGMLGYYVVLEAAFGWTLGKLITGTRVVRFDGSKPRVPQIIGRTFARYIPFEPFSLLFGSERQGWHDSLSGTRVVRVRR